MTIEAKELRIGNWVYQSDAYGDMPITAYQIYQFDLFCMGDIVADYYKGFKPIPLTEEWLVRLGFTKKDNEFRDYEKDRYTITVEDTTTMWVADCVINTIEYVHQLQNLYHALTGEELKITT